MIYCEVVKKGERYRGITNPHHVMIIYIWDYYEIKMPLTIIMLTCLVNTSN